MMNWGRGKKILFTICALFLMLPVFAQAQSLRTNIMDQIRVGGESASYNSSVDNPQTFAAGLIQIFLGLLATIFLILILMSGYWLITARGDESKYDKALSTIKRAIIGFTLVIASYALVSLIARVIVSSTVPDVDRVRCVPDRSVPGTIDTSACARFIDESSCLAADMSDCLWMP